MTRRLKLTVAYDGTAYAGWQRQINAVSVQEVIERALEELQGRPTPITGASRTDSGVHAVGQVFHLDTASTIPNDKFPFALNTRLPRDIRVINAEPVADNFHARYHASGKQYRYLIHNHPHSPALERNLRWHVPYRVDTGQMQDEASSLLGTHDFGAFAASGSCIKSTVRTIYNVSIQNDAELITLLIEGNGFLYNMVRIIAGTLVDVGCGRRPRGAIMRAIDSRDRLELGQTAPPHGLTLMKIWYEVNS